MTLSRWTALSGPFQSLLRIVAAFIFMQSGTMKTFAFPIGVPPNGGTVPLASQVGVGGVLEFVCGAMLLLGWYTRPNAFLMSGMMAVAYFQVHAPNGFWPVVNGGIAAALYCFLWLYFSAAGGGPWSIDALRRRA